MTPDPPSLARLPERLPGLIALEGAVRHYAWGSRTFLAELRAQPSPSAEPEAELWLGDHPSAPALARLGGRAVPLDALIAARPVDILGADRPASGGDARLPFLLKVLAAERPLSVQLHPDAPAARAGWEREEAAGVARSSPLRLYPDPHAKPEIACAITRFTALQGLRRPAETRELLAAIGGPACRALLDACAPGDPAALLGAVLALDREAAVTLAVEVARGARGLPAPERAAVGRLAAGYAGEALIAAPLLMNLVELEPGEALFTPPRVLHAYLGGAVVELMGSSDNVLRAGLTAKHVDPAELLRALDPTPTVPRVLHPAAVPGSPWRRFPDTGPIGLALADLGAPGEPEEVAEPGAASPHVLLVLRGELVARTDGGDHGDGDPLRLGPGQAALVRAGAPPYRLRGEARVYRASAAFED
jgi:mannose-6-phosphate isomerase